MINVKPALLVVVILFNAGIMIGGAQFWRSTRFYLGMQFGISFLLVLKAFTTLKQLVHLQPDFKFQFNPWFEQIYVWSLKCLRRNPLWLFIFSYWESRTYWHEYLVLFLIYLIEAYMGMLIGIFTSILLSQIVTLTNVRIQKIN
mgnify:CR=1 FL=1